MDSGCNNTIRRASQGGGQISVLASSTVEAATELRRHAVISQFACCYMQSNVLNDLAEAKRRRTDFWPEPVTFRRVYGYLRLTRLPRHNRGPVPGNRSAASCLCTVLRRALYHCATRSPQEASDGKNPKQVATKVQLSSLESSENFSPDLFVSPQSALLVVCVESGRIFWPEPVVKKGEPGRGSKDRRRKRTGREEGRMQL